MKSLIKSFKQRLFFVKPLKLFLSFFLSFVFIFSFTFSAPALNSSQQKEDFQICFFSLNNELEFKEMNHFVEKLNLNSSYNILVKEYMLEGDDPKNSFKQMIEKKEVCDGLVISGHHTGAFGGKRANGSLGIDFLEKNSCDEQKKAWFLNVKALWLQGCRTLGTSKQIEENEELSADFHTERVGDVLDEDHLEQSFRSLNVEFSTTLDQDNTLSSRYLRVFPKANVFGWTKSAPGTNAQSELSLPFHIAQLAKLLIKNPLNTNLENPQSSSFKKESVLIYNNSLKTILTGESEDLSILAWLNHGNVKNQSIDHGFYNPDLQAYESLFGSDNHILKEARQYDCLLKDLKDKKDLIILDEILENEQFIKFTYNSLLNKLKDLKEEIKKIDEDKKFASTKFTVNEEYQFSIKKQKTKTLHTLMLKKLKESKTLSHFLLKKLQSKRVGIITKLDYFSFYEEIYGEKNHLKEALLDNVIQIFDKTPSNTYDERDYKHTLFRTLSKNNYLKGDKAFSLVLKAANDDEWGSYFARIAVIEQAYNFQDRGFEILEIGMKDEWWQTRIEVIRQVLNFKNKDRGFPILKKGIEDEQWRIRRAAIVQAYKFQDRGFEILEIGMKDEQWRIRRAAIVQAYKFQDRGFEILEIGMKDERWQTRIVAIEQAYKFQDRGFNLLEKGLEDKNWEVRMEAIKQSSYFGDRGWMLINKKIKDKNWEERYLAVYGASFFKKGFPLIEIGLEDEHFEVRKVAIWGTAKFGDRGWMLINKKIKDKNWEERYLAVYGASFFKKGFPLIERGLEDEHFEVRKVAIWGTAKFGDRGWMLINKKIKDKNWEVRMEAIKQSSYFGDRGWMLINKKIKDKNWEVRMEAIKQSSYFGDRGWMLINKKIKDKNWEERYLAVYGASFFKKGFPLIEIGLEDEHFEVRKAAVWAASKFQDRGFNLLEKGLEDKNWKVRMEAIKQSSYFGDKGFPILKKGLKDKDTKVRKMAMKKVRIAGEVYNDWLNEN